ncbi:MAG TPA: IS200/IS605 family transposase [Acidobacteriaceae bacterium]
MPQSLSLILVHIIFSTKDRRPALDETIRPALFAYLAGIARTTGCECYRVGGISDHVHLAIRLARTMTAAKLVQELKTSSTKWLKDRSPHHARFAWQRGYAIFSVGPSHRDALTQYIDTQQQHHEQYSFQEELRALLTKYGFESDERYLWD